MACPTQCLGKFLGIIGQNPTLSKSDRLQVVIFVPKIDYNTLFGILQFPPEFMLNGIVSKIMIFLHFDNLQKNLIFIKTA